MELVVGLGVHEHEVLALAVEVLHLALVDDRLLELLVGAIGAIEHRPGADVVLPAAHVAQHLGLQQQAIGLAQLVLVVVLALHLASGAELLPLPELVSPAGFAPVPSARWR